MKKLGALLLAGAVAGAAVLAGCGAPPADNTAADGSYTPDAGYTAGNGDVVQLNGFRSIDIEWVSGQVNVELYDGEGISLTETLADGSPVGQAMEWRVDEDDSTLDVRSQPKLVSLAEEKILTVKLPRSMVLYELDIETVSAAISVYAANAGEIALSTTSGAIEGSVRTQKLETDSVSGSIDLTLDTLPTELDAETTDGNIVMQLRDLSTLPSPLPVEFKTTSGTLSGDVTLTTVQDAAWEFQTVSGNVNLCTIK